MNVANSYNIAFMDQFEQIIIKALELHDNGKTVAEILVLFPDYRVDLEQVFTAVGKFESAKEAIFPDKKLLSATLVRLEVGEHSVTTNNFSRYSLQGEQKGRSQILSKLIFNFHSRLNWKVSFPLGIMALVAILFFSTQVARPVYEQLAANHRQAVAMHTIDATVDSVIASAEDENASLEEETGDIKLVNSQNEALSDFDNNNYQYEY